MNYSDEIKPAQILNITPLEELTDRIYLSKDNDYAYFSSKKPENNTTRSVFTLETSDINTQPTIRGVNCINKNKKYASYVSFVIETKEKSKGIVIVLLKLDEAKTFYCNCRILPFNTLNDIAEREFDSKLLTVNLERADAIVKTDITITPSNTGEALYSTHDVDVNSLSELITDGEMTDLRRELEFQGAQLIAHFCQEMLEIVLSESTVSVSNNLLFSEDYIIKLPNNQLKDLLLSTTINGCICTEIVGEMAIKDINRDWIGATSFIRYMV